MGRMDTQERIIGSISLLANRFHRFGDRIFPDITFKQWFLLLMLSHMGEGEKHLNAVAAFVGTTRQNVRKLLGPLSRKGYVTLAPSPQDGRAVEVALTEKAYAHFQATLAPAEAAADRLFAPFREEELEDLCRALDKLLACFAAYEGEEGAP